MIVIMIPVVPQDAAALLRRLKLYLPDHVASTQADKCGISKIGAVPALCGLYAVTTARWAVVQFNFGQVKPTVHYELWRCDHLFSALGSMRDLILHVHRCKAVRLLSDGFRRETWRLEKYIA